MNIIESFSESFSKRKHTVAIEFEGKEVTFSDLDTYSDSIAVLLQEHGIQKGDRVATFSTNTLDLVYAVLGILKAGAIVVPVDANFKALEISHVMQNSGAKVIFTEISLLQEVEKIKESTEMLSIILAEPNIHSACIQEVIQNHKKPKNVDIADDDGAIMFYTSGTTGKPKGALLSHFNVTSNFYANKTIWELDENDRFLLVLPLSHIHGLAISLLNSFYIGNFTLLHKKLNAEKTLEDLQHKKMSIFTATPTIYYKLLDVKNVKDYDISSARIFISASAPMPLEVHRQFEETFGKRIVERAGMSESMNNFSNPYKGLRKLGTVGFPVPGMKLRIVDEHFNDKKTNEIGLILIKGDNVFNSYWNDPEKTRKSFHDGWFITDDMGKIDEQGYVSIVGRTKDVIKSGGLSLFPREIEEILEQHPAVKESAVVAVPDKVFGESVKAYIILKPGRYATAEDIIAFCKESIASYKKPKYVEFLTELPKNTMGKIDKKKLREWAAASAAE